MAPTEAEVSPEELEVQEQRAAATEANMRAAGLATEDRIAVDYFAFDETHIVHLPDGVQYVEIKALTEGDKRKYQNLLSREAKIQKVTGDTVLKLAPGDERYHLLKMSIVGWNLVKSGMDVPCNEKYVEEFLAKAPPRVIDVVEKEVRKLNPWLLQEVSVEDIDKEIADLQELRAKRVEEEEGKAASSDK